MSAIQLCQISHLEKVLAPLVEQAVQRALANHTQAVAPPGALRAAAAAAYIGTSRSGFYQLLEKDHRPAAISVSMGGYRVWPKADLGQRLQERRARVASPNAREAA